MENDIIMHGRRTQNRMFGAGRIIVFAVDETSYVREYTSSRYSTLPSRTPRRARIISTRLRNPSYHKYTLIN